MLKTMLLFFLFLVSGCAFNPFLDSRREAGSLQRVGISTSDYPAVCYNSYYTTPENLIKIAKEECSKTNRRVTFYKQTKFTCKFFMPHHAIFKCVD